MDIEELKKEPIKYLKTLTKTNIVKFLIHADNAFTNTSKPLISDDMYDIVKNYLKNIDPKNSYFKRVGADVENKITLPFWLGSQDKIKDDEKEINRWMTKYSDPSQYLVSEKLDGISCLIYYNNNNINIYTRGNGKEGQDISYIIDYIQNIPKLKKDIKLAVRGELIISRDDWETIKDVGSNARNVVAGAINAKIINKNIMSKIQFIAYDCLFPRSPIKEALEYLNTLKFKIVKYEIIDKLSLNYLSDLLQKWRKSSKFDIDGIVVYHNKEHKIIVGKNPKYSFAFKSILTQEKAEVIVNEVEWNISKDRYLKPIVKFNEVVINGIKIKQATGFNASYIYNNNIGAGSRIIIIRSGDVIPHIFSVISPSANGKPSMPDIEYIWNDTNVDILLKGETKNREQDIKAFIYFMKTLNIGYLGDGNITKIYDAGYDTLIKIIKITVDDLLKIDGFKEVSANKIANSLNEIKNKDCANLIHASNMLGRGLGEKKINLILETYPFIINNREKSLKLNIDDLCKIEGVSNITATQFIENLPKFYEFYDELGIKCISKNVDKKEDGIFKDKIIVFSGFRNKELEKHIIDNGGKIGNGITGKTSLVIIKSLDKITGKIKEAQDKGIKIMLLDEFLKL